MTKFLEIIEKVKYESPDKDEVLFLFEESENQEKALQLFESATFVRKKEIGNIFKWSGGIAKVLMCNLEPFCLYCPYWRDENQLPLSIDEILKAVSYIQSLGFKEFHLSGGTTLGSEGKDVLFIVEQIRKAGFNEMLIDVNCGASMSLETLKELKNLGVKKISAVFETINPELFKKLKPGDDLEKKKEFACLIGEAGLKLGTGILAGLNPKGMNYLNYADFIFFVKNYEHLDSVYVSKFFPFKGVVFNDNPECSTWEAARVIAMLRLVLRDKNISSAPTSLK